MPVVIMAYGPSRVTLTGQPAWSVHGEFVKYYDPDGNEGQGDAEFTTDVAKALKFETIDDARAFALRVSTKRPLRADRKPNRPLTTFTLKFEEIIT